MNQKMILQLIKRDFIAYRKQILLLSLFILIISMLITFINTNTLGIFSSGIGNIIMIVLGAFAVDQSNNVIRMQTASLPVSRKEIVFARFISSAIIVVVNTIIHFVVFNVITASINEYPVFTDLKLLAFALIYSVFQLSIYYFVFYRINLIISVIVFVMPAMIWTAVSPGAGFLNDVIPENFLYIGAFTLVTVMILTISFYTSVKYYRRKDL